MTRDRRRTDNRQLMTNVWHCHIIKTYKHIIILFGQEKKKRNRTYSYGISKLRKIRNELRKIHILLLKKKKKKKKMKIKSCFSAHNNNNNNNHTS
jgi:hypothetical protein